MDGMAFMLYCLHRCIYSSSLIISKVSLLIRPLYSSLYDSRQIGWSWLQEYIALDSDPGRVVADNVY